MLPWNHLLHDWYVMQAATQTTCNKHIRFLHLQPHKDPLVTQGQPLHTVRDLGPGLGAVCCAGWDYVDGGFVSFYFLHTMKRPILWSCLVGGFQSQAFSLMFAPNWKCLTFYQVATRCNATYKLQPNIVSCACAIIFWKTTNTNAA